MGPQIPYVFIWDLGEEGWSRGDLQAREGPSHKDQSWPGLQITPVGWKVPGRLTGQETETQSGGVSCVTMRSEYGLNRGGDAER